MVMEDVSVTMFKLGSSFMHSVLENVHEDHDVQTWPIFLPM